MIYYTYRAEWSDQYCQYVGLCLEFKGRFAVALTPHEAIERVGRMVGSSRNWPTSAWIPHPRSPTTATAGISRCAPRASCMSGSPSRLRNKASH
ncbi:hypothetical protein MHPYR_330054 [uncultured Mycobacterium sp.]|uniref:Uncharacterized protein n=1 Tax=uncultured Mycobacterium sp. TaxID=171292 RepID=A0A1Y5PD60_9MYCO|nr:hypothetical protein MHPYR_330054 [uncultured Mycobacterium sp.]